MSKPYTPEGRNATIEMIANADLSGLSDDTLRFLRRYLFTDSQAIHKAHLCVDEASRWLGESSIDDTGSESRRESAALRDRDTESESLIADLRARLAALEAGTNPRAPI